MDLELLSYFAQAEEINKDLGSVSEPRLDTVWRDFALFSVLTDSFLSSCVSICEASVKRSDPTSV